MKKIILFIADFILLSLSLYIISFWHWGEPRFWESTNALIYNYRYYLIVSNIIILYFSGLYGAKVSSKSFVIIRAFLTQMFTVVFLGFIVFFFRLDDNISRFLMFYYFLLTTLLLFLNRFFTHRLWLIFGKKRDIVLIGNYRESKRLLHLSKFFKYHNFNVLGFVSLKKSSQNKTFTMSGKTVLYLGVLEDIIKQENIINKDIKLIMTKHELDPKYTSLIEDLTLNNYNIDVVPDFYEFVYGKAYMDFSFNIPLIKFGLAQKEFYFFLKRLFDIVVSIFLLIIFSPVMILVSILIPLESKGSPFYLQKRIGRFGKEFIIIKFRSMHQGTDKTTRMPSDGEDDPRITKMGKFIRKTRIDELPQLICVIFGTMSLIGPRPEWIALTKNFENIKFYQLRHLVRPGITGWAQVNFRYTASVEDTAEKLKYDLFYVKNMSIDLDVEILFKTISVVLRKKGM